MLTTPKELRMYSMILVSLIFNSWLALCFTVSPAGGSGRGGGERDKGSVQWRAIAKNNLLYSNIIIIIIIKQTA